MEGIKQLATAKRRALLNLPSYSLGEEIWNAVSHGIGAGLSVAALVLLMVFTPKTPVHIFSLLVYSISMILLYVISTLYHALPVTKRKKDFSNFRSLYHFLYDSRHVYAYAVVMRKRNHRLGYVGSGMGSIDHWYCV